MIQADHSAHISTSAKTTLTIDQQFKNTNLTLITITEDKLQLTLLLHKEKVEQSRAWSTPVGICISMILTFMTADINKDFLSLKAEVWEAVFIIFMSGSFIWSIKTAFSAYSSRSSIDDLMKSIKNLK